MNLEKILEEYGLKENHAKIYLACLELGSAPILKISQKAGFARSTCEAVLEHLQAEGFVSSFRKKRVKYFSAEDPHKLVSLAKEKASLLERGLPQFISLYGNSSVLPSVRFYKGKQGMKIILQEMLEEAKELLGFSSADDLFAAISDYSEFVKKRVELKIPAKIILRHSEKALQRQKTGEKELREVRLISSSYEFHGLVFMWANKVAMFSLKKELAGVVIESEELVEIQRSMFWNIWNSLPKARVLNCGKRW